MGPGERNWPGALFRIAPGPSPLGTEHPCGIYRTSSSLLALVSGLTAAAALAQSDRPWVDPPNGLSEPAQVPQTTPPRPPPAPRPKRLPRRLRLRLLSVRSVLSLKRRDRSHRP